MPHPAWSARHKFEQEHRPLRRLVHQLLHQRGSLLDQKRPAPSAEGIDARAASQAQARQTECWP